MSTATGPIPITCLDRRMGERRVDCRRDSDEIKLHLHEIDKQIVISSNFRSQAKVVGIIALAIFGGSFWYTSDHISKSGKELDHVRDNVTFQSRAIREEIQFKVSTMNVDAEKEFNKFHQQLNIHETRIDNLEGDYRLQKDRYERLMQNVVNLDERVTELILVILLGDDEKKKEAYLKQRSK